MRANIFLSHAGNDAVLAEFIEKTVISMAHDATVFRTSRPDQLLSGESWFRAIEDNLRVASAYLVLITPNSESRPWILFEAGAAWYSQKPLIPVVVGMDKGTLDEPLRLLQVLDLENESDMRVAFTRLGVPTPESTTFVNAVRAIAASLPAGTKARPEWLEASFGGNRYVWAGPVHQLPLGPGTSMPLGLYAVLQAHGLALRTGFVDDPDGAEASQGYHPVFFVDKWGARHWLWTEDRQVVYAKPAERTVLST